MVSLWSFLPPQAALLITTTTKGYDSIYNLQASSELGQEHTRARVHIHCPNCLKTTYQKRQNTILPSV